MMADSCSGAGWGGSRGWRDAGVQKTWMTGPRQTGRQAAGHRLEQLEQKGEGPVLSDPVWWFQEDKVGGPLALQVEPLTRASPYSGMASYSFCKASLILSWLCQRGLAMCSAPKSAWQTSPLSPRCYSVYGRLSGLTCCSKLLQSCENYFPDLTWATFFLLEWSNRGHTVAIFAYLTALEGI